MLKAVKGAYGSLFDIVLTIPAPRPMVVKGHLTVIASAGMTVDAQNFADFDLTAEWFDAASQIQKRSFRFPVSTSVIDGTAGFSITGNETLYVSDVKGDVTVTVRGLDPSSLWSRGFAPDDPELADLAITVPLQVRSTFTVPDVPPNDPNLRLRGRVVVLHRNCAVKDLLVLIKAKATADGDWRVVGAATADAVGNFSLPYPYGTYVAAQASCSVAPPRRRHDPHRRRHRRPDDLRRVPLPARGELARPGQAVRRRRLRLRRSGRQAGPAAGLRGPHRLRRVLPGPRDRVHQPQQAQPHDQRIRLPGHREDLGPRRRVVRVVAP